MQMRIVINYINFIKALALGLEPQTTTSELNLRSQAHYYARIV